MGDTLMLDLLCAISGDIGVLRADARELKERIGLLVDQTASICRRLDRVGGDVDLIKRRLNLVGAG